MQFYFEQRKRGKKKKNVDPEMAGKKQTIRSVCEALFQDYSQQQHLNIAPTILKRNQHPERGIARQPTKINDMAGKIWL